MKIAEVQPVLKKERKQEISNYRPTSVLPVLSKFLEILIYKRVLTPLNKHMMSESQNGFRGKSNAAKQTFIEDIQKALDNKLLVMGIFLDLTKAFDVINHKLLLAKLELNELTGKIHPWINPCLTGRTEFVEI
jgi:hypothetical protein